MGNDFTFSHPDRGNVLPADQTSEEERKKDKEIVDKLYRIVAETENKVERRRRIHDAIFTYCEK